MSLSVRNFFILKIPILRKKPYHDAAFYEVQRPLSGSAFFLNDLVYRYLAISVKVSQFVKTLHSGYIFNYFLN